MSSIVLELQRELVESTAPVSRLLRKAKLIAVKLELGEIEQFLEKESNGYAPDDVLPKYRIFNTAQLMVLHPHRGWMDAGPLRCEFRVRQPLSVVEDLALEKVVVSSPPQKVAVCEILTGDDSFASQLHQKICFPGLKMKEITDAVRNKLLDWTLVLEKNGILGENMAFNDEEKQRARGDTYNIHQSTVGAIGPGASTSGTQYNYRTIYQALTEAGVPKQTRGELEEVIDRLNKASPDDRPKMLEKAKDWVIKNGPALGTAMEMLKRLFE